MSPRLKKIIIVIAVVILLIAGWKLFSSYVLYDAAVNKAQDTQRIGDFQNLQISLMLYHAEHGTYPQNLNELVPRYLSKLPLDPREGETNGSPACESAMGESTFSYRYELTESGKKFVLSACLEEGKILTISSNKNE